MRLVSTVVILGLAGSAAAQFSNPGAYTSPESAGNTTGHNLLFFGNSYTISSTNPAVHTPSYGGARGIPELVRQVAIAAGHPAPFVKNVFHTNRGLDHHLSPSNVSLGHIDEPMLDGEEWSHVVLQGFSTRSTWHPYTGNPPLHQENSWRMYDEVRSGSTNHTSQHPGVVPVLYQTWARHPDHWFYNPASPNSSGNNIAIGLGNWTGGSLFENPAEMAAQVRTSYDEARRLIEGRAPSSGVRIARVGDAWAEGQWGIGFGNLYSSDFYHASSRGDLLTALTIYGTIYGDTNTLAIVAAGSLQATIDAIGVTAQEAAQLAQWADQVLSNPPVAQPPQYPASSVLIDFADEAGLVVGAEVLPIAGRHYNTIGSHIAGRTLDAVDTENRVTPIDVVIVDPFADETSAGANGGFIGAVNLSGSLYDPLAMRDSFFVGTGAGYNDPLARVEVRDLDPSQRYDLVIYGSRNSTSLMRIGHFTVQGVTKVLNAAHNLNQVARFSDVLPDGAGTISIEITNGGMGFAYLGVLEIRPSARLVGGEAPSPGGSLDLVFQAPGWGGNLALTGTSLGLGPTLYGPHMLRVDVDPLFGATFGLSSAVFVGYAQTLDASGNASMTLSLPAASVLTGLTFHTVSLVAEATAPGGVAVVSNPWSMRVR